jgi:drug/metabolite transporter (DMT)-like permease
VLPCLVILASEVAWSLGAVLTRSMPLPRSRSLTAGGAMMLGGIVLLALSLLGGEADPLPLHSFAGRPRAVVADRGWLRVGDSAVKS